MSRGLSVAEINASAGPHRSVAPLIEMYFDSGTLRLAVAPWNITVGANTYIRAPVEPQKLKESALSSEGLSLKLSGLSTDILVLMTAEPYHGRTIRLLKAYLQPDTGGVYDVPKPWFIGRMRNMVGSETNSRADVMLFAEHYDVELQRPAPLLYTDADQQRLFPGDRGCEYTARNADKTVVWPSKEAQKYSGSLIDGILDNARRRRGGG